MGRRVVYIIVEELDGREGTDIALKLENGAQSIELKGGGGPFKVEGTDLKADTIELNGGEKLTIDNPAKQEAISQMVQSERDASQTQPTSVRKDNDDTIQPQPFRKRLASHFGNLTWETVKTAFRASIAGVVRFLFHLLIH